MKYLIFGNGYLGNKFKEYLGSSAIVSSVDIGKEEDVNYALDYVAPKYVINCAGKTGKPNIDWCEDHKDETTYSNVIAPFILAKACKLSSIPMAHIGSGCIYQGDNQSNGFTELDIPLLDKQPSHYSLTKVLAEAMLDTMDILQIRIRMPIDANLSNPRNFIHKIVNYKNVINCVNSMTIVEDMLSTTIQLLEKDRTGIYNVVNPGLMSHREILDMYKELVDPKFTYNIIPLKELTTKAGRSNCMLNIDKLKKEGIDLPDIRSVIKKILINTVS